MNCPKCTTRTRVVESRDGGMMRRHECPSCGHRFKTTEVIVAESNGERTRMRTGESNRKDLRKLLRSLKPMVQCND